MASHSVGRHSSGAFAILRRYQGLQLGGIVAVVLLGGWGRGPDRLELRRLERGICLWVVNEIDVVRYGVGGSNQATAERASSACYVYGVHHFPKVIASV